MSDSVVDSITNSSGTTYIWSTEENLESFRNFIQDILNLADDKLNVDEILDIKLTAHSYFKEAVRSLYEMPEFDAFLDFEEEVDISFNSQILEKIKDLDENEFEEYLEEQLHLDFPQWNPNGWALVNAFSGKPLPSTVLKIESKNRQNCYDYNLYRLFNAQNFTKGPIFGGD